MKCVLALVAAVLHELQTMRRCALVLRGGVARYTRLAGLSAGGAFKVDDDTTLCSFFGHGVLRRFELNGTFALGPAQIWRIRAAVNGTLLSVPEADCVVTCAKCVEPVDWSAFDGGMRPSSQW